MLTLPEVIFFVGWLVPVVSYLMRMYRVQLIYFLHLLTKCQFEYLAAYAMVIHAKSCALFMGKIRGNYVSNKNFKYG